MAAPQCKTICFAGAGPQLDVPHDVTPAQLETLLNGLLEQEEKLPFTFYIDEQPLLEALGLHLARQQVMTAVLMLIVPSSLRACRRMPSRELPQSAAWKQQMRTTVQHIIKGSDCRMSAWQASLSAVGTSRLQQKH